MRILEVCPYDLGRPGGVQRHILDLAAALARAGHEVVLLAPATPSAQASHALPPGCAILSLGRFQTWRLHGTAFEVARASRAELQGLLRLHSEKPFDVVHFHTLWTPWLPWQVFRLFSGSGIRYVATFHDTPPPTWSGRLMRVAFRLLSRLLTRRIGAAIAVSASPAGHLWLAPGCRFHTLPPCIDLSGLLAIPAIAEPERPPSILFIGRLEPRKGVMLLIESFARVRRRHPRARLLICGEGEQSEAARERVAQLDLAGAVEFTGALDDAAKTRLYRQADIFCAPSPYGESYGLVLAEAMAAGLPVVAAANSGYRTVLTGEGAAGLVKPGDTAALADTLATFLASPALRHSLSAWGRRQALDSDIGHRLDAFTRILATEFSA
jgi:phosphatidyl-myo-inositol alpha-mannosyltransferase